MLKVNTQSLLVVNLSIMEKPNKSSVYKDSWDIKEGLQRKSELEEIREKRLAYFATVNKKDVEANDMSNIAPSSRGDADQTPSPACPDNNPVSVPVANTDSKRDNCNPPHSHCYNEWRGENELHGSEVFVPDREILLNGGEDSLTGSTYHNGMYSGKLHSTALNHKMSHENQLESETGTFNISKADKTDTIGVNRNSPQHFVRDNQEKVPYAHDETTVSGKFVPQMSQEPDRRLYHDMPPPLRQPQLSGEPDQRLFYNIPSPVRQSQSSIWDSEASVQPRILHDSVNLDSKTYVMSDLGSSTTDIAQLGLSTHRPSSDRNGQTNNTTDSTDPRIPGTQLPAEPEPKRKPCNEDNLHEEVCDQELRDLLGEDKYKEFLAKSLKDIQALKQERQSFRDPGLTAGKRSQLDDPAIMAIGSSLSDKLARKLAEEDERSSKYSMGQDCQPKLSRPKESPSLVQNSVIKTRGDLDKEIPQVQQQYGMKNYEQVTVPRKATFSSDEIYHQAFGSGAVYQQQQQYIHMVNSRGQYPMFYNNVQVPYQYSVPSDFGSVAKDQDMNQHVATHQDMTHSVATHQDMKQHPTSPYTEEYEEYPPPSMLMYSPHPPQNASPRRAVQHARSHPSVWLPQSPQESITHGFIPHPPFGQQAPFGPPSTAPFQIAQPPTSPHQQVYVHEGFQYPALQSPVLQGNGPVNCVPRPQWPATLKTSPFGPSQSYQAISPHQGHYSQDQPLGWAAEQHGAQPTCPSQQHIEGVRLHHQNRRLNGGKPDGQLLDAGQQFAVDKLEKYFSSIEDLYIDRDRTADPDEQDGYKNEYSNPAEPGCKVEVDELDASMDDELETLVASTIANLKVGGVTERLRDLGIDIPFLKSPRVDTGEEQKTTELALNPPLSPKFKVAKVCPECSSLNKPYMSWCASCGEVIIGVEAIKVKSKRHKGKKTTYGKKKVKKQSVQFSPENDCGSVCPREADIFISESSQPMGDPQLIQPDPKLSPEPQENIDSGRGPSSGEERQASILTGRTEREITEICQLIDDPIVKAFIKSYLKKKRNKPSADLHKSLYRTEEYIGESGPKPAETVSEDLKKEEEVWLHEVRGLTRKEQDKPVTGHGKGDDTSIDIEVFAKEDDSDRPSVTRNGLQIPLLDLGNSSDEEQNKKPCKELELTFTDDEDDIIDGLLQEEGQGDASKVVQNGLLEKLLADPRVKTAPSTSARPASQSSHATLDQRPNSASRILSNTPKQPRSPSKLGATSADRHVQQSKTGKIRGQVRMSIEAEPRKRHWMRSSIAWSSYNPGELQRERSVPSSQWRADVKGRRHPTKQEEVSSPDSEDYPAQNGSRTNSRPASADVRRRRTRPTDRASSAGTRKKNSWEGQREINLKSRTTTDLRKVCGDKKNKPAPSDKVNLNMESDQSDYVPMPVSKVTDPVSTPTSTLQASSSVQSAYDRYHEMTPRIYDGSFSVWLCLPEELLLHILSHLSLADLYRCALVCKHFYRVSMDQTLWRSITLKKRYDIGDEWLEEIGKRHPRCLSLIQCHGANASSEGLQRMFQHCGQYLEELNFSSCSRGALVGDAILLQASVRCKHLTHIDMSWNFVTDNGLCSISTTAHRLSSVCMNGCQSISNHGLEHLLRKHGKSMRTLELFGCFNINQKGIRSIGTHCHNLRTLNLGQCYKVTDSCITEVTGSLPRLENLDLRGCKQIKDSCIRKIVKNCPRVTSLALANCPHISDIGLSEIATYLKHIRWIDLCGCRQVTDESLRALSKNCQNLRYIDISSTGCTRKSVIVLATFCCDRLEVVKLNFLTDADEPSVLMLIHNCKRLNTLQLYGCKGIRLTKDRLQQEYPQLTVEMG